MPYIYATLSSDQNYSVYEEQKKTAGGVLAPRALIGSVKINGKANIANKVLVTPRGAVTEVSDEELKLLRQCECFERHEEGGYVSVESRKTDPNKAAKNLTAKDKSAPITKGAKSVGNDEKGDS